MLFKGKNGALSSLDVLLCLIHEDIFFYTFSILDIYKFFFLPYVLNNNPLITYKSCETKATLIVGEKVTKGGFLNLCTSFCSFNSLSVSVSLI